jgi:membrane-bound lytic murein transglycosylase F
MVAQNKISYTVASYKTAQLYKSIYKKLDLHLAIGFEQHNGWLVRRESEKLKEAIENWIKTDEHELLQANLTNKYWTRSIYFSQRKVRIPKGSISPFDHFFKKYATEISWDWKLLAAVAFHESRFDSSQVSWAGASGIMQLMPRTAANFGLTRKTMLNPEKKHRSRCAIYKKSQSYIP